MNKKSSQQSALSDQQLLSFDNPPELTSQEKQIIGALGRGRHNAISMPTLAAITDISTRVLQDIIKHLVEDHGILIASACGKPNGYYYPDGPDEYKDAVDQLKHRIISLARRIRAIDRTAYEEIFGQTQIKL